MKFSFIHIADIHLGRSFSDLSDVIYNTDVCNTACKTSLEKITDLAISRKVDFVLIAGDSFDNNEHDLSTKLLFRKTLEKLANNGIKSYVICGNHDPVELYKKHFSYFKFDDKYKDLINITGVTTEDYKHSFSPTEGVNIHTVSFKTDESESFVNDLPTLNEQTKHDFNIGLIHCDLDKTDSKYAPMSREELRNLGYDYYALGHIHLPEIKEDGVAKIVYAGTPQSRTKKETGAHGCYLVEADNGSINIEFIPTDCVRFNSVDIDCSECNNKLEVFEEIVDNLNKLETDVDLELFEVNLIGITPIYRELENLIEDYTQNFGEATKIKVHKINNNTIPYIDENELSKASGVVGILSKIDNSDNVIDLDNIYENLVKNHENIYQKLGIDSESKNFLSASLKVDKEVILENVKKEIKSLCSEIYNIE